jgi:ATP-dependent DNA ligase
VGYTAPRRSRRYFGALVLAVRQGSQWGYVGHAGTGFDEEMLLPALSMREEFRRRVADVGTR